MVGGSMDPGPWPYRVIAIDSRDPYFAINQYDAPSRGSIAINNRDPESRSSLGIHRIVFSVLDLSIAHLHRPGRPYMVSSRYLDPDPNYYLNLVKRSPFVRFRISRHSRPQGSWFNSLRFFPVMGYPSSRDIWPFQSRRSIGQNVYGGLRVRVLRCNLSDRQAQRTIPEPEPTEKSNQRVPKSQGWRSYKVRVLITRRVRIEP